MAAEGKGGKGAKGDVDNVGAEERYGEEEGEERG